MGIDESQAPLIPIDQDTVPFYGHDLIAVTLPDGGIAAVLRWLCDGLHLNMQSQLRVIRGRTALADGLVSVQVMTEGGPQTMAALTLDVLPGWLFAVDERRVKAEAQADVVLFQRECVRALATYFENKQRKLPALAAPQAAVPTDPQIADQIAQIRGQIDSLYGVANLLQEHLVGLLALPSQVAELGGELSEQIWHALGMLEELAARQDTLDERQDTAETHIARIDERTQHLTPAHARTVQDEINGMVQDTKHLAQPLTYTIIYGRLKHHWRVSTYKEIADKQYGAVMAYLQDELRRALAGEGPAQGSLF